MDQATNTISGTVLGMTFLGINMQDWAAIFAIVWIACQMGYWTYSKFIKKKE